MCVCVCIDVYLSARVNRGRSGCKQTSSSVRCDISYEWVAWLVSLSHSPSISFLVYLSGLGEIYKNTWNENKWKGKGKKTGTKSHSPSACDQPPGHARFVEIKTNNNKTERRDGWRIVRDC